MLQYPADLTGQCSLAICTSDDSIFDNAPPSLDQPNNCTYTCPGGFTKPTVATTLQPTTSYSVNGMYINEIYYDYGKFFPNGK